MVEGKDFFIEINHRGIQTPTIVGSDLYEGYVFRYVKNSKLGVTLTAPYEHRPDLISNDLLGSPDNWWLLMEINSVFDPFEGFKSGDTIIG